MRYSKLIRWPAALIAAACLWGQEPRVTPKAPGGDASADGVSSAAISGSGQDPAAFQRGGRVFATFCAGCHGIAGKGGPGAPDLIRSVLVLDDEKKRINIFDKSCRDNVHLCTTISSYTITNQTKQI